MYPIMPNIENWGVGRGVVHLWLLVGLYFLVHLQD